MSDPKNIGNAADEQAEHEAGADFANINRSPAPGPSEPVEVHVQHDDKNLVLIPERAPDKAARSIELREGPRELLKAQMFDDPAMAMRASGDITRTASRGHLQFFAIRNSIAVAVWGDRVLIQRDSMESAYSCRTCKGTGHTDTHCPTCKGSTVDLDGGSPCRSCHVLGYGMETQRPCGFTECPFCGGSGWSGGIVIPDVAAVAPISGIVVSCGPECVNLQLGDRVVHSKYSGHQQTTPEGEFYTIMREVEVLEIIKEL